MAAKPNKCRRLVSEISELADTLKKVDWHSEATALAIIVLPFPGGPYNNIPLVGSRGPVNISGRSYG